MELRHLKMIREVAISGNLTKATERLYLSQSALSHQLKEVEEFFGTQIFIRQKKQMLLTTAGKLIFEMGEKVINELEATKKTVQNITQKDTGEIRISTECYTSYHWLSGFLSEFNALYPKVELVIDADATTHALGHLLNNKLDVAIVEENKSRKLDYTPLFSDEFYVLIANQHAWADRHWIEINELPAEPYIMYHLPEEESSLYQLFFKKKKPVKLYKIMLTEAILEMVKAGIGFTVMPYWVASQYVDTGQVSAIRITRRGLKRTWYAATLKDKEIPAYMMAFIKNLAKHLKKSNQLKIAV
jgi:LysR family transcriptional regulator for metE and metH